MNYFSQFQHHDLERQNETALMNRVDTKFILPLDCLSNLEKIKKDFSLLKIGETTKFGYDSLYFDTADQKLYRDHHNGKLNRFKIRLRRYRENNHCYLEIKRRTSQSRTVKERIFLSDTNTIGYSQLLRICHAFMKKSGQPALLLTPTLYTHYSRYTLLHRSEPIRVTVDTQLSFHSLVNTNHYKLNTLGVVEVKTEKESSNTVVHNMMKSLAIRPARFSKYCMGMNLTSSVSKHNAFKPSLLALQKITTKEGLGQDKKNPATRDLALGGYCGVFY